MAIETWLLFCICVIGFLMILVYSNNQKISDFESRQNKLLLEAVLK